MFHLKIYLLESKKTVKHSTLEIAKVNQKQTITMNDLWKKLGCLCWKLVKFARRNEFPPESKIWKLGDAGKLQFSCVAKIVFSFFICFLCLHYWRLLVLALVSSTLSQLASLLCFYFCNSSTLKVDSFENLSNKIISSLYVFSVLNLSANWSVIFYPDTTLCIHLPSYWMS